MKAFSSIKSKKNFSFGISFFLVLVVLFLLFSWFNQNASPKFIHVAELYINQYISKVTNRFKTFLSQNPNDFLTIHKNQEGEIVTMDYNMKNVYSLADRLTTVLEENILTIYQEENLPFDIDPSYHQGFLLFMPIGVVSDSIFLANLGPKIPVYVRFVGSVFSNVKTKVQDYGINNALLDIYLEIEVQYEILTPVTSSLKTFSYDLLLDSEVIQGNIPNLYGGYMESRSSFFEVLFP